MLADFDVGVTGADLLVRTTIFLRRVRFHIEDVDLAWSTPLEKEDDRLCLWRDRDRRQPFLSALQNSWHGEPEKSHAAGLDHGATGRLGGESAEAGAGGINRSGEFLGLLVVGRKPISV